MYEEEEYMKLTEEQQEHMETIIYRKLKEKNKCNKCLWGFVKELVREGVIKKES